MKKILLSEVLEIIVAKNNFFLTDKDVYVESFTCDSRKVKKGDIFFAIDDELSKGSEFIQDAFLRGAALVVSDKEPEKKISGPFAVVEDVAESFSAFASFYYLNPDRTMNLFAITGTNGKTTVSYILEAIFSSLSYSVGVIGTINYRYAGKVFPAPNTTPIAQKYFEVLASMKSDGVTHVVSEVSSHGLKLKRVTDIDFNAALFTNLTQDHLDFHPDFNDYYESKKLLFTRALINSKKENKLAAINIDDPWGSRLSEDLRNLLKVDSKGSSVQVLSLSCSDSEADYFIRDLDLSLDGSSFTLFSPYGKFNFETSLIGLHNVYNIISAVALAASSSLPMDRIVEAVKNFKAVPGRLERVEGSRGAYVFVDYAHTPDALQNVLSSLKNTASGRIITVFGCGGDRDNKKRPLMGEVASRLSDEVVVTSDNPRCEDPDTIIDQIIPGIKIHKSNFYREKDRYQAIATGITLAEEGDIVLIAGKGHEDYQILGKTKIHFSDIEEAKKIILESDI